MIALFRKIRLFYGTPVAGVVSTAPGLILGGSSAGAPCLPPTTDYSPPTGDSQALVEIVPVKATTENGPIQIGDLLVSSSTPGVAMRGDPEACVGAVIGKAMEPLENGTGVITTQVMLR